LKWKKKLHLVGILSGESGVPEAYIHLFFFLQSAENLDVVDTRPLEQKIGDKVLSMRTLCSRLCCSSFTYFPFGLAVQNWKARQSAYDELKALVSDPECDAAVYNEYGKIRLHYAPHRNDIP
jgi:hypothetical protein